MRRRELFGQTWWIAGSQARLVEIAREGVRPRLRPRKYDLIRRRSTRARAGSAAGRPLRHSQPDL